MPCLLAYSTSALRRTTFILQFIHLFTLYSQSSIYARLSVCQTRLWSNSRCLLVTCLLTSHSNGLVPYYQLDPYMQSQHNPVRGDEMYIKHKF